MKITKITKQSGFIEIIGLSGGDSVRIESHTSLIETMIELHTRYKVQPVMLSDLEDIDMSLAETLTRALSHMPTVRVSVNSEVVIAATRDGDTGAEVTEEGSSIFAAVANLVAAHGYKAEWTDKIERGTVMNWLERFQYGFARASREQLESELEAILSPEKASW